MKLKDLKNVIPKRTLITIPELGSGIAYWYNEKISRDYDDREVERIFVDHKDESLGIELKKLKLKDNGLIRSGMPRKLFIEKDDSLHELNDYIMEEYGEELINKIRFLLTDEGCYILEMVIEGNREVSDEN